ncbi:hypothetical protein NX059_007924 [Plenodomus lindquistii]|nr:hypothetical protein NX059_007924 [Plenodomus lindquistii]
MGSLQHESFNNVPAGKRMHPPRDDGTYSEPRDKAYSAKTSINPVKRPRAGTQLAMTGSYSEDRKSWKSLFNDQPEGDTWEDRRKPDSLISIHHETNTLLDL